MNKRVPAIGESDVMLGGIKNPPSPRCRCNYCRRRRREIALARRLLTEMPRHIRVAIRKGGRV